jgi:hypothetical protein
MSTVPRRDGSRPTFQRRSGIVSSADIEAAVRASGIPDDTEFTGPMGIRDSSAQRKLASEIREPSKKKKKK